jgi:hypothetical protein
MHSSDILVPPPSTSTRPEAADGTTPENVVDERTETQKRLWSTACDRIERFLPGFMGQVLPVDEGVVERGRERTVVVAM